MTALSTHIKHPSSHIHTYKHKSMRYLLWHFRVNWLITLFNRSNEGKRIICLLFFSLTHSLTQWHLTFFVIYVAIVLHFSFIIFPPLNFKWFFSRSNHTNENLLKFWRVFLTLQLLKKKCLFVMCRQKWKFSFFSIHLSVVRKGNRMWFVKERYDAKDRKIFLETNLCRDEIKIFFWVLTMCRSHFNLLII